jgi:hypothetical protein
LIKSIELLPVGLGRNRHARLAEHASPSGAWMHASAQSENSM